MSVIRNTIFEENLIKLCFQYDESNNYWQDTDMEYVSSYCNNNFDFSEMIPYIVHTDVCESTGFNRVADYKWEKEMKQRQAVVNIKYEVPKKTIYGIDVSISKQMGNTIYFSIEPLLIKRIDEIHYNLGYGSLVLLIKQGNNNKKVFDHIAQTFANNQHEIAAEGNLYYCDLYSTLVSKFQGMYCLHYSMYGGGGVRRYLNGKAEFNTTLPIYSFDIYNWRNW